MIVGISFIVNDSTFDTRGIFPPSEFHTLFDTAGARLFLGHCCRSTPRLATSDCADTGYSLNRLSPVSRPCGLRRNGIRSATL